MAKAKPQAAKRKRVRDPQVTIVGSRVAAAMAAARLSVKAAAKLLMDRGLARISQSALNTVARGRTATTRASVRAGLARLVGEALDPEGRWLTPDVIDTYLAGHGPDLSARDLVRLRLALRPWDADWVGLPPKVGGASLEEVAEQLREPMRRMDEARRAKELALTTVLDLERWKSLIGDARAQVSEEARVEFARLLSRALEFVTELPIPESSPAGNRIRRLAGIQALAAVLEKTNDPGA